MLQRPWLSRAPGGAAFDDDAALVSVTDRTRGDPSSA
jgi:hypothetical protein